MKTSIHLLSATGLLFGLLLGNNTPAEAKTPKPNSKKAEQKITAFFTDYLAGKEELYNEQTTLKLSDIPEQQNKVWESWRTVNNGLSEQKLPELKALENTQAESWKLPASMEPNAVMPYYWGAKGTTKPEEGYPLYLYTHGSGPKANEWSTGLKICQMFDDAPSAYFIPQIPNEGNYYRWWQKSKQYAWEKLLRLAFVSGNINPNKVYVFGISEGGYGSQRLASFYADYWAGAGPMAGGEPLKNAPVENCKNIAFSFLTGAADGGFYRNKLTQYTKDEFQKFQTLYPDDFIHRIELIPGRGHSIDYRQTTPWLKQYTRNPYPKTVLWENLDMDGQYRKGFYNLFVKEASNEDNKTRTYYQMEIKGNEVNLKVDLITYKATEIDPRWGIELKFEKSSQPATKGKVVIYLCQELVDLNNPVTVKVNGKQLFQGMVEPNLKHMVNSCATFFDPERLYPAAIEVDLAQ